MVILVSFCHQEAHIGRFVDRFGYVLKCGKIKHHAEAGALEDVYHDHGRHCGLGSSEETLFGEEVYSHRLEDAREHAEVRAVYECPDYADHEEVENIRHEERRTKEAMKPELVVEQNRKE